MKILVTGDREWTDYTTIFNTLFAYTFLSIPITLIHGACAGADTLAGNIGKSLGWKVIPYPANWSLLGLAAGPSRNQYMVDRSPDLVIAFHPNLKESTGTADCVRRARSAGIDVKVIEGRELLT